MMRLRRTSHNGVRTSNGAMSLAILSCMPSFSASMIGSVTSTTAVRPMLGAAVSSLIWFTPRFTITTDAAPFKFAVRRGIEGEENSSSLSTISGANDTIISQTEGAACIDNEFPLYVSQELDSVLESVTKISKSNANHGNLQKSESKTAHRNSVVDEYFDHLIGSERLQKEIQIMAQDVKPLLLKARRTLHQYPELMYGEEKTSFILQYILRELGIPFTTGWAKNIYPDAYDGRPGGYGIVVEFGKTKESSSSSDSNGATPCVLLRGDMDGLPILEETEHKANTVMASQHDGRMHACGHDAHMTMLLGATVLLHRMEDSIRDMGGVVRIMFQPAEEGGAGAKRMIEEGVLSMDPPVQAAFGMHVWPGLPSGKIGGRPGSILAAAEMFEIVVTGVGGHAAMPHQTTDPVPAVSAITLSLQTLVSRELSPLESGVVSVTGIDTGGNAFNVIPAKVKMGGTIRALTNETLLKLRRRLSEVASAVATAHECTVDITYMKDFYPPTVNDPELYDFATQVASPLSTDHSVEEVEPTMGGEDFSFVAQEVPSVFFVLGQGSGKNDGPPTNFGLHHPKFNLDEDVLSTGVQLHVNLALQTLQRLREQQMDAEKQ